MTRRSVLALALIPLALGLAACANEAPGGPTAPPPGSGAPSPGVALTEWPVVPPADGTLNCFDIERGLSAALEAIDGVTSVRDATISSPACADKSIASPIVGAVAYVAVSVEEVDAAELVALTNAIHEAEVSAVAPATPFRTFLTVIFPNGSEFKVNGGSLLVDEALAGDLVTLQSTIHKATITAYIPALMTDVPEFGQFPASSMESKVEVDGLSASTEADMEALINEANGDLVDVSSQESPRHFIDVVRPAPEASGPYDRTVPTNFPIPVEFGEPIDPAWAEVAVLWVDLVKDGNPHMLSFGSTHGMGHVQYWDDALTSEDEARIDELVELLDGVLDRVDRYVQ